MATSHRTVVLLGSNIPKYTVDTILALPHEPRRVRATLYTASTSGLFILNDPDELNAGNGGLVINNYNLYSPLVIVSNAAIYVSAAATTPAAIDTLRIFCEYDHDQFSEH